MAGKREVWLQVASASSSKHFHITSFVILKSGDMYCSVDIWFRRFLSAAPEETQRSAADKSDQILSLICLNWYKAELNSAVVVVDIKVSYTFNMSVNITYM